MSFMIFSPLAVLASNVPVFREADIVVFERAGGVMWIMFIWRGLVVVEVGRLVLLDDVLPFQDDKDTTNYKLHILRA